MVREQTVSEYGLMIHDTSQRCDTICEACHGGDYNDTLDKGTCVYGHATLMFERITRRVQQVRAVQVSFSAVL